MCEAVIDSTSLGKNLYFSLCVDLYVYIFCMKSYSCMQVSVIANAADRLILSVKIHLVYLETGLFIQPILCKKGRFQANSVIFSHHIM